MAKGDQINFKPHFRDERREGEPDLPCEGDAGDFFVFTPLSEGEPDDSQQGLASLWFCIKGDERERPATWARVQFDGIAACDVSLPLPPQNRPQINRG